MSADGRFAPSPSGPLHIGSLRTALVAWLMARSQHARFLVRIEDLDPQRSRPEHERSQLADLRTLGIDWDEEPVRQSQRLWLYNDALGKLHAQGVLYPCFCTRAQILLQRLLGLPPVSYAHVSLVISAEGTRLAKRDRAVTLADRHEPADVTLALLAHSSGLASGRDRVKSPIDLLPEFDPARIPSEPLVIS
jgi:glutamyl/glutaminyl-tRNA synthetase